jgi:hypothetical protein
LRLTVGSGGVASAHPVLQVVHVDGERVGDGAGISAWTSYAKRVLYHRHDRRSPERSTSMPSALSSLML